MRKIKFRVRDLKENKWVSPNILIDYSGLLFWSFGGDVGLIDNKGRYDVQFYTGLKDKNRKEIYEGDVVRDISSRKDKGKGRDIWEIVWRTNGYLVRRLPKPNKDDWDWMTSHDGYIYYDTETFEDFEIIGNIYENPELLEERK